MYNLFNIIIYDLFITYLLFLFSINYLIINVYYYIIILEINSLYKIIFF